MHLKLTNVNSKIDSISSIIEKIKKQKLVESKTWPRLYVDAGFSQDRHNKM